MDSIKFISDEDYRKINERSGVSVGDVLFAVVNYARHNGIEPEVALDGTNNRFASRFNYVEKQVEASGKTWQDFTLNELDGFWNQAKDLERKSDL